jgi:2-succinyl-5-enolpyruvyl-6-hydroxy-3-cyclohexene-1-carboxylate synthase
MAVSDFLSAIKYAGLVVTNSFHGACFSLLAQVPFIVIDDRPEMSSRFKTLKQKFGFSSRFITTPDKLPSIPLTMNYATFPQKLGRQRDRVNKFLSEVL